MALSRFHPRSLLLRLGVATAVALAAALPAAAKDLPGKGIVVKPAYDPTAEAVFQTDVVIIGLQRLGYTVKPGVPLDVPATYLSVSTGDMTFSATAWDPLHKSFFDKAGGNEKLAELGALIQGATQGYFIDKKTAQAYKITNIEQLKDPKIAALFSDGTSSMAQLVGCPPGWGCERVIEHQLTAYDLRKTVHHVQGEMAVLATDTIARYKEGKPVLYYTFTPLWLSEVLVPGRDVEYLQVPFTSLPENSDTANTKLPDGRNIGFNINTIRVLANRDFVTKNPAAAKWFELVTIPVGDVNNENYQIYKGEKSMAQIHGHAEKWIADNKAKVDGWIAEAMKAAN